ncbi:MAG: discoidin domain-containing protein [Dorea sp.]|nr:discoidin domain-containing protein [Dorea sp.]
MAITVSSDYRTNKGSLNNIIDGNRTSYWSAQDAQAAGKSITFSFSGPVTFKGMTAVSGSANGTQILKGTLLQVSRDGSSWKDVGSFDGQLTSMISGLNEHRVMAVRILWNRGNNKRLAFYEAELDYSDEYAYRKIDGVWIPIQAAYRKSAAGWVETKDLSDIQNENLIERGTE